MYWCQVGSSPSCSLLPYESNPFNYRDVAEAKHIRHLRFILGGLKSDVFSAQTHEELMSLIPRNWQSSSHYMVYNGSTLSPRSTVHGLHLQDDQIGDVHLTLRIRGGGNLCECGDRESSVQSPTTRGGIHLLLVETQHGVHITRRASIDPLCTAQGSLINEKTKSPLGLLDVLPVSTSQQS